ncbi:MULTISPECIES: DUF3021 domain-containing protein [Peptoniphilus]|uniref:DUF3021 domain-containing protein n=1 Tax=Peptoniphilus TaxID=162289 RepID=UPI0001DA9EEF|nr:MULTISPECIES: DUF3021 domain-containing protein [Peptoniphilus]EFI41541.1 hypothetical protein HMPREF0629_00163 [Peptoniphilus sp. oral taxon 386 str. F0131]
MKTFKNFINSCLIGIGIGNSINLLFCILAGTYSPGVPSYIATQNSVLSAVTKETILYALFGVVSVIAGYIYRNEKFSLLLRTILNLSVIFCYFIFTGYTLHWFINMATVIASSFLFFAIYIIIWISIYREIKKDVELLNKKLNEKNLN